MLKALLRFSNSLISDHGRLLEGSLRSSAPPSKPLDQAGRVIDLPSLGAAAEEAVERFSNYLGHRNIQLTARYTALVSSRFKGLWS
ncbi:MAG TPA: hypothetical protein VNQ72_03670 [Candidatus Dormibacteraeota bacterium]|nr:hypothetical protein [Candidatus Dormibacteraeota bacterium]